jgi:hypothetical protein
MSVSFGLHQPQYEIHLLLHGSTSSVQLKQNWIGATCVCVCVCVYVCVCVCVCSLERGLDQAQKTLGRIVTLNANVHVLNVCFHFASLERTLYIFLQKDCRMLLSQVCMTNVDTENY